MEKSKNILSIKKKSLKRQNKRTSNNIKKRINEKRLQESNEPDNFCEIVKYFPSGSNDLYDNNTNSENYENSEVDDEENHDHDVFADLEENVKKENYSDTEDYETQAIKQEFIDLHSTIEFHNEEQLNSRNDTIRKTVPELIPHPSDHNIFKTIMTKLDKISAKNDQNFKLLSAQNNEIMKQQVSINANLKMLDRRIQRIETKLQCDVKIDDFVIETLNNVEELKQFLLSVQDDREYSSKCVIYLHKHCPKGSSKHTHFGVIKGIIDKLFTPSFKNACGWSSEKNKTKSENVKTNRVLLSEHYAFQKLILDVLNFNSNETFTMGHVADGIKEYYKRFVRKAIDSETEGVLT